MSAPKKIAGLNSERTSAHNAQIIQELRPKYALDGLLKLAGMARSTFYYQKNIAGLRDKYADLKAMIASVYHTHRGRYGYRRITLALRQLGQCINHKTVQRLMRQLGLKSLVRPKRYKSYRGNAGIIAAV
jgi:hypothetical protein